MCKPIYRALVAGLASEMVKQLKANEHKGDRENWVNLKEKELLNEIYYHTGKLQQALKDNDAARIKEHCADIANLTAFMLDVKGLTDLDKRVPQPQRQHIPADFNGS